MSISYKNSKHIIYPDSTFIKNNYIEAEYHNITADHFHTISIYVQQKKSFLLKTAFDCIPDFIWYKKNNSHTIIPYTHHYTYLIGEHDNYYLLVDRPEYLIDINQNRCKNNKGILQIPKKHFSNALNKYCQIKSLHFNNLPECKEDEINFLYENYQKQNSGKKALDYFKNAMNIQEYTVLSNFDGYHMLLSRRVILKKCIYNFKNEIKNSTKLLNYLDMSIIYFRQIKDLSKNYIYHKRIPSLDANRLIEILIDNEEKIMECIQYALLPT